MKQILTEPEFFIEPPVAVDDAATHDYLVHLAKRSAPEDHQVERLGARNEAHAREMAAYLFADSVVLRVQAERRRGLATAYPDARFIKGEFRPTSADAELMAAARAD